MLLLKIALVILFYVCCIIGECLISIPMEIKGYNTLTLGMKVAQFFYIFFKYDRIIVTWSWFLYMVSFILT